MEAALAAPTDGQTDLKNLNEQERADLLACEETIGRSFQSFVEVGLALVRIRDERLYRQDYYYFDQYCRHRWGVSRIHAHRSIEAARVHEMLPIGNKPANEAQVRPLTRIRTDDGTLDQKAIARVWQRVVDNAPVDDAGRKVITAKVVEEAAQPVLRRRRLMTGSGVRGRRGPAAPVSEDKQEIAAENPTAVKMNISDEEFARLHEHVEKLAKLMITETLPVPVRLVIEDVCDIVLGGPV
jgi:hypothetical protein